MKFLSESMTSASGSIGGVTYSHNRSGMYRRARRVPVNPNTTFQQSQRDAFTTASAAWRAITSGQRAAWEAYATATPITNPLGQTIFQTGAQAFTGLNSLLLRLGVPQQDDAPSTPGRQALGMPTIVVDNSASTAVIASIDAAVDGGVVGLFLGDLVSAGVSFFAGPYQLRGSGTPAAGTFTIATLSGRNGSALTTGGRLPFRMVGVAADGALLRLTQVMSGITTIVA